MPDDKLKIDSRRNKIISILDRDRSVQVSQLSRELKTTSVTIRSDLRYLENNGYLERVQGGALQTAVSYSNREFLIRKREKADAKKRIASALSALVGDGSSIFINSGSTSYYAALELKSKKNLKIVTNSLTIATELGGIPTFNVILLGGEINSSYAFVYGSDALDQLERCKANIAILSIDGLCSNEGVSTMHAEEVLIDRMMIKRADESIIIADKSKLEQEGFLYVCGIEKISRLVTEKGTPSPILRDFKEKGLKVSLG